MFKASHVCGLFLVFFLLALCGPAVAGHKERPQKKGILLVAFGTTVSGRPPELAGVEQMVGLFINTVPVRVRLNPAHSLERLLGAVQA